MVKNKIRISISQEDNLHINLNPEDNINVDFNNRLVLKYVEPDHSKLDNLDYENSGHTGFMPAKLSLLPRVPRAVQNGHLMLSTYNTNTEETNSIEFDDLRKRIIKTSTAFSSADQKGQYIFIEINKEDN